MAISGADATTIATLLKLRGGVAEGGTDTITLANYLRKHRGLTGTDARVISAYAEASRDTDLVTLASRIRTKQGGIA